MTGRIEVAVLNQSRDATAARDFAKYVVAPDRGGVHFRAAKFRVVENAAKWASRCGELKDWIVFSATRLYRKA